MTKLPTRRDFLKQTALAATALAGSSLHCFGAGGPPGQTSTALPWYRRTLRWGQRWGQTNITMIVSLHPGLAFASTGWASRAGRGDAFQHASKRARRAREHRHHARLRWPAPTAGDQRSPGSEAGGTRTSPRRHRPGHRICLRRHPRNDGTASEATPRNRLSYRRQRGYR